MRSARRYGRHLMPQPQTHSRELSDDQMRARIEAALSGDRAAMTAILDELLPIVHVRVARAMIRRRHQARGRDLRTDLEDFVQEVFAALFKNDGRALRQWDPTRGLSFTGFVGFLAERQVALAMRSDRRNPWTEDPTNEESLIRLSGTDTSTETRIQTRERLAHLSEHLRERLSPRGRQYFQMIFVERRPIAEVAKATGATPQAIYAWRSRLTKVLRKLDANEATDVE